MSQTKIGSKNQVVIPTAVRTKIKGFKPGKKIQTYVIDEKTVGLKLADEPWTAQSYGVLKTKSQGSLADHVLKQRSDWDR